MAGTLVDCAGLLAATTLLAILLVLPGAAIAAWLGAKELGRSRPWGIALLCSLAVLPALLSLIARLASLDAALAALLALALLGIPAAAKMERPPLSAIGALLAGSLVVALELVDIRFGGKLYHPTFALDMVKHAATVNSIVSWGLPLTDPFVSRAQPSGYYYFFYVVAAMPVRLTMGVLDARAAVGALAVFDGAGLLTLAVLLWQRAMPGRPASRRVVLALGALLLCGNLDIIPAGVLGLGFKAWPVQIEWWNVQVLPWLFLPLWVPHHLLALIAGVFGLLLVSDRPGAASAIVAGVAFASCAGASVWVGFATALAALFWLASLIIRREHRMTLTLAAAGCLAGFLLVPQIYDILQDRAGKAFPIALTIRSFPALDPLFPPGFATTLLNLVLLPVNYFVGFGVLAVGAILFWRNHRSAAKTEAGRLLICAAAAGLLLATFTRSTLLYNDLAWRAVLLPQLAALIWTCAVILDQDGKFRIADCLKWPGAMGALLLIGYAGNIYQLVMVRAYPLLAPNLIFVPSVVSNPEVDDELASAYGWVNAHVPRDAVLQHNPVSNLRVLDFGLYGRNRVAVADSEARLYGASQAEVDTRLAAIGSIFTTPLAAAEVRSRALAQGVDVLVVSSIDPVWSDRRDWVWSAPALFASPHVRLIATRDLAPER
jgi:hypothetical protein